ncbi:protein NRT1/ PTR FAMILY 5.5-like [Salvia hispanica]|uniref:protein NRT1/ PTR FAMILY 5.5-like n=1 Tax=Salvia hispanica TaxID=49212 RepID=UPI002009D0A4|nr:protein NRT1/ PTR FAMILY 5.5-like [Salvia hispanica]XP_047979936.1 protein NRT1/ PTR FAMILY 5.5-like [Salvia hispanica]XP_047979937.1 protein NRT1/ PTR FAMILY 5.5-like [Salvia hispanica]XP_047979938.1 protein NRT1/ PTR FAMILY 5.5-like [Salvia hispanica]
MADEKKSFVRISALLWADVLVAYALFVMQNYLTDVWGLSLIHAALILNIWNGVYRILPLFFLYLVDKYLGYLKLLVFTSLAYAAGITMVAVSTPPLANATGTCKRYEPECVGRAQKDILIAGLALVAVGVAGNLVSLLPYLKKKSDGTSANVYQIIGLIGVVVVPIVGAIALPYIRPPTLKFGIPAICTVVGTFLFLTGFSKYTDDDPSRNSPLFNVFRVFVAASLKIFRSHPVSNKDYHGYEIGKKKFTTTRCLGGLHKAAIILPGEVPPTGKSWTLCTVEQVEEAKIAVRMVPMWMTFIVCGVVAAIGDTYFVEQAGKLNRNIGRIKLPIQVLLLVRRSTKDWLGGKVTEFLKKFKTDWAPSCGIAAGMLCSILCCISAALVERKRLDVVRSDGLLDQPDKQIKMSIYWLVFQFVLLGGLEAFLENSVSVYYRDQSPESVAVANYLVNFIRGVTGLGYMCSALSVYVVGKISEKGGRTNWFQHTLNRSRLDNYYWVLAGLSSVNMVVFVFVASFYRYKKPEECRRTPDAGGGYTDPYNEGDQNRTCCCFC